MNDMKRSLLRVLLTVVLVAVTPCYAISQIQGGRQYTKENPLVYEDAWDLWPYVFLNEHGEPEGFNVDVLKELFKDLKIPYVIKLKPTSKALEDMKAGRSDLMLRLAHSFHEDYGRYGQEVVQLFTHSVVSPKSQPLEVRSLNDLKTHQVIVHTGSLSHRMMIDQGNEANCLPYGDMKEAIQKVSSEERGLIVWNTLSLKWLMKKFQTQNLQITPLDIPHGEYRFMSNDTVLLHRLDSAYARFCSTDRMQPIQNKWFYPERVDSGIPGWVAYAVGAVALLAFLMLYYVIVLRIKEQKITRLIDKHNKRLALILRTTKIRIWLYDVATKKMYWLSDSGELDTHPFSLEEFGSTYTEDTFSQLKATLDKVAAGQEDNCVTGLKSDEAHDSREYVVTLTVFRRSGKNVPQVVLGMMDDQTERLLAQRKAKDNMLRYQSIFSTSMVDMTYYDTEGILTNINQKACETFHCDRDQILAERVPFNYALEDPDITLENFEGSYTTHLIKAVNNDSLAKSANIQKDSYYEQQLVPLYDAGNRFLGIFGSGRDVTEFVNSYHRLKLNINQLKYAAQDITDYINNINFALHVGGVRLVNYSPQSHLLTIYKEMNVVQLTLTQTRCLYLTEEHSKRIAMRMLNNMDMYTEDTIDVDIDTVVRAANHQTLSLQFHLLPIRNERGEIENYFGLCRDMTAERATERELQREKLKAQEVENVKNVFLRNMSYEIRTPITTVVGFAKLFVEDHDPADEDDFIKEIKDNSTYLLKLVNDILFLSRLDAHMIEFNNSDIDLAYTFEGHCQMGWAKSMKPGVNYVVEVPYEHLVVNIDDANVGHIIEQIAENAAHYTEQGTVKARFDYIGDRLLITIDDTGKGISPEARKTMFERFSSSMGSNSTGLGLPICVELAQQMGGAIYVNSAEGKGTTVWILIPCKATLVEKKLISN